MEQQQQQTTSDCCLNISVNRSNVKDHNSNDHKANDNDNSNINNNNNSNNNNRMWANSTANCPQVLKNQSDRTQLQDVFGGDCTRIARIRAICLLAALQQQQQQQ